MFSEFLNLIFPQQCKLCKHPNSKPLCEKCLSNFERFENKQPEITSVFFDSAISGGIYSGRLKETVKLLKYKNGKLLAPYLADFMLNSFSSIERNVDIVTYVPMSKRKEVSRGYNQSKLLASELSKLIKKPCYELLTRISDNVEQNKSNSAARHKNIKGAFIVNRKFTNKLPGFGKVLLIDDVFTTGSTVNECSRVLKIAGVQEVRVATLARPLYLYEN
jgi:competence protein ComFC